MSVATLKDFWEPLRPAGGDAVPVVKVRRLCPKTGKIRFDTKQEARVQLRELQQTGHEEARKVYRCWSCGDWHTGHA